MWAEGAIVGGMGGESYANKLEGYSHILASYPQSGILEASW